MCASQGLETFRGSQQQAKEDRAFGQQQAHVIVFRPCVLSLSSGPALSGSAVSEKCLNFSRLHLFIHYGDYENTHLFLNILVTTKNTACGGSSLGSTALDLEVGGWIALSLTLASARQGSPEPILQSICSGLFALGVSLCHTGTDTVRPLSLPCVWHEVAGVQPGTGALDTQWTSEPCLRWAI